MVASHARVVNILDFIAPRSCAFCGVPTAPPEESICAPCFADLPWNIRPGAVCSGVFDWSGAMMRYEFPIDVAIKAFKFQRKLFYAPAFVEILDLARPQLPNDVDAVLSVPLHWWRKTRRGFNQASEIAGPFAKRVGRPRMRGVHRHVATPFQSGLDAKHRAKNLQHAFTIRGHMRFKHILIIDDVITTGATAEALARTLLIGGAEKVSVLAVARAG